MIGPVWRILPSLPAWRTDAGRVRPSPPGSLFLYRFSTVASGVTRDSRNGRKLSSPAR